MGEARTTARGAAINIVATLFKLGLNIFVVVPILARVLGPDIFGLAAMAMTIFLFLSVFGDAGLPPALIRDRSSTSETWTSAFWMTVFIGVGFAAVSHITAPFLADFYNQPEITPLARVLGYAILFQTICSIPIAWLQREQKLGHVALAETLSVVLSGIVAIWMGLTGYGVWALVIQQLVLGASRFALSYGLARFDRHVTWHFAWHEVRPLLGFSLSLTGASFVAFLNRRSDSILIGRYLGAEMMGMYSRAFQLMQLPNQVIAKGLGFASYPAMARVAHDRNWLSMLYLKQLGAMSFLAFPLMIGLSVLAEPLILTLLGEKWVTIAPTFAFLAVAGLAQAFVAGGGDVFKVLGHADRLLIWAILRFCVFLPSFVLGVWMESTLWLAIFYSIANVILLVPYQVEIARLLKQTVRQQAEHMIPPLVASLVMAGALAVCQPLIEPMISFAPLRLAALILLGIALYFAMLRLAFAEFMFFNLAHAKHLLRK